MARNYCSFWVAAGTIGGSPVTSALWDAGELQTFLALLDPGSLVYQPKSAWIAFDKGVFQQWLNRFLGSVIYDPASDAEPLVFLQSPRGRGKIEFLTGSYVSRVAHITFHH